MSFLDHYRPLVISFLVIHAVLGMGSILWSEPSDTLNVFWLFPKLCVTIALRGNLYNGKKYQLHIQKRTNIQNTKVTQKIRYQKLQTIQFKGGFLNSPAFLSTCLCVSRFLSFFSFIMLHIYVPIHIL